jgi:hypothetical protein
VLVFAVVAAYQSSHFSPLVRLGGLVIAAQFGFLGLTLLKSAEQHSADYLIDDEGIQRRSWTGQTELLWREVVQVDEACVVTSKSLVPIRLAFLGRDGTRIDLGSSSVAESEQTMALLEPRLAPFRIAAVRRLEEAGRIYQTDRTTGMVLCLLIAPWFVMVGASALFEPQSFPGGVTPGWLMFLCWVGCLGLVLAAQGIDFLTRRLLVTNDGLYLRSCFLNRAIPFDGLDSLATIDVKRDNNDPPVTERTIFRGGRGQVIEIHSSRPDYRAIREFVGHQMKSREGKGKPFDHDLD